MKNTSDMSIHSKKGSIASKIKSNETILGDSPVNLKRESQSDTHVQKTFQTKTTTSFPPNLMSEMIFPIEEFKAVGECVSETEKIADSGEDQRTLNTLVSELEGEVDILKLENSLLESKLKQTENMLANAKMKIKQGHSSQELNIVIGHLKQELNKVKIKNNRLKGSSDSYQSDQLKAKDFEKSLNDSIIERLNLQEFLDVIKCTIEPKQYNMIMDTYRQKTGKEIATDKSETSIEHAPVKISSKRRKERIPSSQNKSGRNKNEVSVSLDKSSVSVQTENTKESSSVKRRKRKQQTNQAESELQISKAENDCLKSELKSKNEQIMKLVKEVEYLSTSSRRRIEELRKDIESLIKKGGQNEALWARCLELKEAKESIEKQFMLYKQAKRNESVGIAVGKERDDSEHKKDLESGNSKEVSREAHLETINQVNRLKVENNRLRNENRNLTLQCQHFQRLALYTHPDIVFEETKTNH